MNSHTQTNVTIENIGESVIRSESVLINRLTDTFTHHGQGEADCILSNIINDVLELEGGQYDNSATECSTPKDAKMIQKFEDNREYDKRLQYWRNYINDRDDIKKKIQERTNKKEHEILMNKSQETDRTKLVKTIMDQSERLNPLVRSLKTPNVLSKHCCEWSDIYETLPKLERDGKSDFAIFDVPEHILKETHIPPYKVNPSSWLNSKDLATKLYQSEKNIARLIAFYPDTNELQVIGQEKKIHDGNAIIVPEEKRKDIFYSPQIEFRIMDADSLRPSEKFPNYILVLNDTILDYNKKGYKSIHFNIMFDVMSLYEKSKHNILNIRNCGNKTIDFKWIPQKPKYKTISTVLNRLGTFTPSFYFDKNPFRLSPGNFKKKKILFNCEKVDICTETWILETDPNFLHNTGKIYCHLLGSCKPCSIYYNRFHNLRTSLTQSANDVMAKTVVTKLAGCVRMPKPDPAYINSFTDAELFTSIYPKMNVSNRYLDELKKLYRDLRIYHPSPSIYPPRWNFDLNDLKRMIFVVDNEKDRKDFYTRFLDIVGNIKELPLKQSQAIAEQQKFTLVRSIILTTMERLDKLAQELKESLIQSDLNLDFDEVLLMNRERIPKSRRFSLKNVEDISENSSRVYEIVKTDTIKKEHLQLLDDTLYFHFAKHLGLMAEEIVAVIEGIKNIF